MGSKVTTAGCLRILHEGPATTKEIAMELGGNSRHVAATLHNLCDQARVVARPFHVDHSVVNLYSLPEHAR